MHAARRRLLLAALGALAAFAVTVASMRMDWLRVPEDIYYDLWHRVAGDRRVPRHVVLVTVDNATLDLYRDDPLAFWGPHFADAMRVLGEAGAVAVGLDYLYMVSAEAWLNKLQLPESEVSRNYDLPLREQLASGRVVAISHLVSSPEGGFKAMFPPDDWLAVLPRAHHDTGVSNLFPDPGDRVVRRFRPAVDEQPDFPGLAFGLQLALRATGGDPLATEWNLPYGHLRRAFEPYLIGFGGPPGTVPTLSMSKLLSPKALEDPAVRAVKGKVIIISAADISTSDQHFSPYSLSLPWSPGLPMIGGEIHANIVETLLSGWAPRPAPEGAAIAFAALLVGVATLAFFRLPWLWAAAAAAGMGAVAAALGYALFQRDIVWPVASPQLGLAVALLMAVGVRLTGEERQRAELKSMFGRYVSDEVVDRLIAAGRPHLGGEAVRVTVLFSDIRNFTTISERLSATEVVEMLNEYFGRTCEPILRHGGTVDKYIGDAVMAIFGAPVHYPDHARRALAAGVEMLEAARGFRSWMAERFPDRDLPEFGIGVGIHTGEAVVGNIGTEKRTEYTAIGDTVNAASRLEGKTKELGWPLVASEDTVNDAGPAVTVGGNATISVKGRDRPIKVMEIVAVAGSGKDLASAS